MFQILAKLLILFSFIPSLVFNGAQNNERSIISATNRQFEFDTTWEIKLDKFNQYISKSSYFSYSQIFTFRDASPQTVPDIYFNFYKEKELIKTEKVVAPLYHFDYFTYHLMVPRSEVYGEVEFECRVKGNYSELDMILFRVPLFLPIVENQIVLTQKQMFLPHYFLYQEGLAIISGDILILNNFDLINYIPEYSHIDFNNLGLKFHLYQDGLNFDYKTCKPRLYVMKKYNGLRYILYSDVSNYRPIIPVDIDFSLRSCDINFSLPYYIDYLTNMSFLDKGEPGKRFYSKGLLYFPFEEEAAHKETEYEIELKNFGQYSYTLKIYLKFIFGENPNEGKFDIVGEIKEPIEDELLKEIII